MEFYEILIIIAAVAIVLGNILAYVYKRKHHIPTGECAACSKGKKFNKVLDNIRNELDEEKSSCSCQMNHN